MTGVKEATFDVGIAVDQNIKYMDKMENAHAALVPFMNENKTGYFGIYDGHGGFEVAEMASRHGLCQNDHFLMI